MYPWNRKIDTSNKKAFKNCLDQILTDIRGLPPSENPKEAHVLLAKRIQVKSVQARKKRDYHRAKWLKEAAEELTA